MIKNHDRSGWFGASDTAYIVGSWNTPSFTAWWGEKLGLIQNTYTNIYMQAGTAYEHRILSALGIVQMDRQIKIRRLRLRVNLDGEDRETITEVKTYGKDVFKVSKAYWGQCQVQMYAARKPCRIAAYRLIDEDYRNYFNPIDPARITLHPIEHDPAWISGLWLPRVEYLRDRLKRRRFPDANQFNL